MRGSILYVEDNDDTRYAMGKLLTREGYRVFAAASYRQAIEIAQRERLDLLIADLDLPDRSAITLLAEIRRFQLIKGIVVSGHDVGEDSARAGYSAHVVKPIVFPNLAALVAKTMNGIAQKMPAAQGDTGALSP